VAAEVKHRHRQLLLPRIDLLQPPILQFPAAATSFGSATPNPANVAWVAQPTAISSPPEGVMQRFATFFHVFYHLIA